MLRLIFVIISLRLSSYGDAQLSPFSFSEEARAALCPFVGYEGMQCFDNNYMKRSGRQFDSGIMNVPRGVGMSVDINTGEIKSLAVQLTYSEEGSNVWTDRYSGNMYEKINEAILSSASRIVASDDTSRVSIFQNASQLDAVWRRRFIDGRIRGGELARQPDVLEYSNVYFKNSEAVALSQRMVDLYTLTLNVSTIQLNSFARHALSQLTNSFDPDLYEAFVNIWGTHVITKSLVGGMVEERAKFMRCIRMADDNKITQCIPFSDRHSMNLTNCAYYGSQARIIFKRYLGGDVNINPENEWKKTLASGPALLQILEMIPWYDFVTSEEVKKNLQSVLRYRHKVADVFQSEGTRQADARFTPCISAPFGSAEIKVNASWNKNGTTVAGGNGQGGLSSQFNLPIGLFIDDNDIIYIADLNNHRIMEWRVGASSGRVVAGGNGYGLGVNQLYHPHDVIVDRVRDSLIIADYAGQRIVRWALRGAINGETIINSGPYVYVTMDDEGSLYATDWLGHTVKRWRFGETQGTIVAGGNGVGSQLNQLNNPRKVFVDRNRSVYVSEYGNHRVVKWMEGAKEGIIVAGGNGKGNSLSQFDYPDGIVVDQFETVYVADRFNHRIVRWMKGAKEGQIVLGGMGLGSQSYQFNQPQGLSFDRYGNLYVTDVHNHRVQKFQIY